MRQKTHTHHDTTTIPWFASLRWVLDAIQPSFDHHYFFNWLLPEHLSCARDCPGIAVPALILIHSFYSSSLQQVYHSLRPTNLLTHPIPCSQKEVCYVKENEAIRTLSLHFLIPAFKVHLWLLFFTVFLQVQRRGWSTEEGQLITTILNSIHTSLSPIYLNSSPLHWLFFLHLDPW